MEDLREDQLEDVRYSYLARSSTGLLIIAPTVPHNMAAIGWQKEQDHITHSQPSLRSQRKPDQSKLKSR